MDASTISKTAAILDTHAQLAELASFERAALVVLAAALAPMNRTEWMRQLRAYGVRKPTSAASWLGADHSALSLEARAVLALQRRELNVARELSVQAWHASAAQGSKGKRPKPQLSSLLAPLLTLLLATGEREQAALARAQLERVTHKGRLPTGYFALAYFLKIPDAQPRPNQSQLRGLAEDLELLCVAKS